MILYSLKGVKYIIPKNFVFLVSASTQTLDSTGFSSCGSKFGTGNEQGARRERNSERAGNNSEPSACRQHYIGEGYVVHLYRTLTGRKCIISACDRLPSLRGDGNLCRARRHARWNRDCHLGV